MFIKLDSSHILTWSSVLKNFTPIWPLLLQISEKKGELFKQIFVHWPQKICVIFPDYYTAPTSRCDAEVQLLNNAIN